VRINLNLYDTFIEYKNFLMKKSIFLLFFINVMSLSAQTFQVDRLKNLTIISTAILLDLSNNHFDDILIKDLSESEIESLDKDDVPFFDRLAFQPYSQNMKDWSDYTVYFAVASGLFLAYDRDYFLDNIMVYTEILMAQSAVCKWVKTFSRRARPYVYDDEITPEKKKQDNSRHSFYSSHSSTAFSVATFGYYIYQDRYGDNIPIAVLLFGSASATAALRVTSANHFPSDVFIGAIMGSSISYLICKMNRSDRFDVELGINSIGISYKF
jgi:membrane-associated phospholipid phosphatase